MRRGVRDHDDGLHGRASRWAAPGASFRPSLRKIHMAGQALLKPDYSRFAPTKAVKRKKPGCTQ